MPTLGAALDFAKLEGRNFRGHQLGSAPGSPVTGQLYYNTGDNTLYWFDGTIWQSAKGGAPGGAAGGDLSGTYPNPQIAAGVITDADVNAANKDGVVGTASMRTLGYGAQQAMPGGATLSTIGTNNAPGAAVPVGGQRIINVGFPAAATDAATMGYVDSVAQGLAPKDSVRVASTASISSGGAPGGPQTIDGVAVANGDRVLLKDQTTAANNGIWVVSTGGSWARSTDADVWSELPSAFTFVEEGTVNADSGWVCTANQGGTLNTTALPWVQFSGAGQITAGAGLTKTGNSLDVGAGAGITVAADTVGITTGGVTDAMLATAKAGYYSSATHGAGTTISITQATHLLRSSRGLLVQCMFESTGAVVEADVVVGATGDVTVTFGASQSANTIRVTIIG